ncbi:MAG: dihydrodipicolinate synthase family protein [Chloroflexi bacterium]|nr:dihydrodipicolinate synthase family protein [Chloroflexota bacterium]
MRPSGPSTAPDPTQSVRSVQARVQPRQIDGISALLLPYRADGQPDWQAYADNLERTASAGLRPAVNMDTGYVHLLTDDERTQVLKIAAQTLGGRPFVAGAFLEDKIGEDRALPGQSADDLIALYCREGEQIRERGGTPILFQSTALTSLPDGEIARVYRAVSERVGPILGFELGSMFAPFGTIYSLGLFEELLQIPGLLGIKHSSLDRAQEWQRLALRDRLRPDFKVYTGNDLAIDMVIYGSDYLLGLSSFAPEAFALRDRLWAAGDARFFMLNDVLQYLGAFAFRAPVPAYKHSAAQFLYLRGRIPDPATHPRSPGRPATDLAILQEISRRLDAVVDAIQTR